ncbi:MAG: TolC family protein [Planctomycetota bacterium]
MQQVVAERTGVSPHWRDGSPADAAIEANIAALLAQELTVDGAVTIALLNNRSLQATYEDLGVAQAELVQAGLLKNPALLAEVRFPSRPAIPFEIDIAEDFLDLFFLPLRKRVAGAAFEAAKLRVTNAVLAAAADAKTRFYMLQGAEQLVDLREQVLRATEAASDAAGKLNEAGNITELEYAHHQVLHEQAKLDLARAEAEALDHREELSALMGLWGERIDWRIAPRLADVPREQLSAAGLETQAIRQRLDLAAAKQDVIAIGQSLGVARFSAFGPELLVTGHYEREPDGIATLGPGIELPLPIFGQGQPAMAAAQARLRQAHEHFFALAVEIRSRVRRFRNRMMEAQARAAFVSRVILPLRHRIVEETQLEYNAMQVGVFALLEAKRAEVDSGREYIETLRDFWVSRSELERELGGKLSSAVAETREPEPTKNQEDHEPGEKHD